VEILEYLIQLRGAAAAGAQVRGLAGEMTKLAASQDRVGASGDKAAAGSGKMAAAMGLVGKVAKVGSLALVAVGLEAVKMSTNFNHEMLRIRTDAGASTKELANMKKGVLDLASSGASMGQGPMSLAAGLYHLESLGIRGSKALFALKLASQEAAISGANLEETTSSLGAAMFVGIKGTGSLTHLMGTLNAVVGSGNMRFQDLNEALGTGMLASAKIAGLSLQDVGAALAVATDAHYKASSAAAQLGTAFHFLYAPTTKATKALDNIGMSSTQMAQDMHKPRGLLVALTDLRDHLLKLPGGLKGVASAQVLNAILPGGRGRVLLNELSMLDRLKVKYDQINKTAGGFQGSVAMQRHDPQTQLKTAEAAAQASMIRLGNVLTPIVLPALTAVLHVGAKFVDWLSTIPHAIQGVIGWFKGLGGGVHQVFKEINGGPKLVTEALKGATGPLADFFRSAVSTFGKVGKIITAFWTRIVRPAFESIGKEATKVFNGSFMKDLSTVGGALLKFGGLIIKVLLTTGKPIVEGFANIVKGAFNIIGGAIHLIAAIINGEWGQAWTALKQIAGGAVTYIAGVLQTMFGPALSATVLAFQTAFGIITGVIKALLGPINDVLGAINTVASAVGSLGSTSSSITPSNVTGNIGGRGGALGATAGGPTPRTPHGATGAVVTRATMAVIGEAGPEMVVPLSKMPGASPLGGGGGWGGGWGGGDIVVQVDGREIARAMRRQVVKSMAAGA